MRFALLLEINILLDSRAIELAKDLSVDDPNGYAQRLEENAYLRRKINEIFRTEYIKEG